ncbi:MAG: precorrin-3B C(17)-methyltransferase [Lachnospiraceae bacterium]|nr:precorrin-3B C(17)-methyltransferase [Lachnospiraceae bacterium]
MGRIIVIGIGPGEQAHMTQRAKECLQEADSIVGYSGYVSLLGEEYTQKEILSTGMKREVLRCRLCFEKALEGKVVALICSGDAGVYGMASLVYELSSEYGKVDIEIVPGVTAAASGAAVLGAPINHDFCTISLSDLLTPWELIAKRLQTAAMGDFVITLYNPSSMKRADYLQKACDLLLEILPEDRACGYVKNIGREGTATWTGTLAELRAEQVDMFTTCFIGNSQSFLLDGKLITPRGYRT